MASSCMDSSLPPRIFRGDESFIGDPDFLGDLDWDIFSGDEDFCPLKILIYLKTS